MAGFGSTANSSSHYISQFLRMQSARESFLNQKQQQEWFRDYSNMDYEYSLQDLLQSEHRDLEVTEYPPVTWVRQSHMHLKTIVSGSNGFWNMSIVKDPRNEKYDFTISVMSGNMYRFHPDVIKNDITAKYGALVYSTWREMVMDDLHCLARLVEAVRERISFVAQSLVCCPSSARLCRKAGIRVSNDFAFLFPANYS
jgi:hypothetical protein